MIKHRKAGLWNLSSMERYRDIRLLLLATQMSSKVGWSISQKGRKEKGWGNSKCGLSQAVFEEECTYSNKNLIHMFQILLYATKFWCTRILWYPEHFLILFMSPVMPYHFLIGNRVLLRINKLVHQQPRAWVKKEKTWRSVNLYIIKMISFLDLCGPYVRRYESFKHKTRL